jgi:uncharacterized protein
MAVTHMLYLHGFRSSPQSMKARQVHAWIARHRPDIYWWCPQLPPSPAQAFDMTLDALRQWPMESTVLVGSSLGGFYATALAEAVGCPAALFNPAVLPARDLARHLGLQTQWHDPLDTFFFREEFIAELEAITPRQLTRMARYHPVIASGDEVLDWREMNARYDGAPMLLIQGSDHALTEFAEPLAYMVRSLGLVPAQASATISP